MRQIYLLLLVVFVFSGCKKDDLPDNQSRVTVTAQYMQNNVQENDKGAKVFVFLNIDARSMNYRFDLKGTMSNGSTVLSPDFTAVCDGKGEAEFILPYGTHTIAVASAKLTGRWIDGKAEIDAPSKKHFFINR